MGVHLTDMTSFNLAQKTIYLSTPIFFKILVESYPVVFEARALIIVRIPVLVTSW